MDVYKASAFEDRVNYAASCIAGCNGHVPQGRHFDTCFEMGDGDYVVAALMRRVLKNPGSKLAQYIHSVLPRAEETYKETAALSRKELAQQAITECVAGCRAVNYSNL
jgi:hypothetical protein